MGKARCDVSCSWTVQKVTLVLTAAKGYSHALRDLSSLWDCKIWGSSSFPGLPTLTPEADVRSWLRCFLDLLPPNIQGFMFQRVWIGWNFNLPSATPSLILEMDLKSHFWDSECVTPWAIWSVHLLLLGPWPGFPSSSELIQRPQGSLMSPWLFGPWFLIWPGNFQIPWLLTVHPMTIVLPSLPQPVKWPFRWKFLVGRLSYTYSFLDVKQLCSLLNLNLWIATEFFVLR